MNERDIASFLVGQSIVIARVINLLVDSGSLDRATVVASLVELRADAARENPKSANPIQHILSMLQVPNDQTSN